MDLIQLYSATRRVVKSLSTSGLMPALKAYRASLRGNGDRAGAEARLIEASNTYIEDLTQFGEHETSVINLLHLGQLGSASFWLDMTSNVRSVEVRMAQAVSAYSKMMFAISHLPSLLSLVRETSAVDSLRADEGDSGALILRLYDSVEPASSPDRMSRLIDAVDIIYTACTAMSEAAADSIRLMSVSGVAVRSVVFHGDAQTINATQKIIHHINRAAEESHRDESYSVEAIASGMPFLTAIEELERLGVLSAGVADGINRDAQEGAIMLLECGAQLAEHTPPADSEFISASIIAKLDADSKSFDNIDSRIGESIDTRYDEVYEREKAKLVNEEAPIHVERKTSTVADVAASSSRGARGAAQPIANKNEAGPPTDSIDELIIDLNRLYGEQR